MIDSGRSREGAWIEIAPVVASPYPDVSRSREGAWIEIRICLGIGIVVIVAPVRERGLKFRRNQWFRIGRSRSREGAWIEITAYKPVLAPAPVAPVRERGLKFVTSSVTVYIIKSLP